MGRVPKESRWRAEIEQSNSRKSRERERAEREQRERKQRKGRDKESKERVDLTLLIISPSDDDNDVSWAHHNYDNCDPD